MPIAKPFTGNDSGIMRPILKQAAFTLQMMGQPAMLILMATAEQNVMMSPLNGADAINLHKPKVGNQVCKASASGLLARWVR
jgi:hypothetical protein